MNTTSTDPRYPIGKYEPQPYSDKQLNEWLNDIRHLPGLLENAISNLDEHQFETPYRHGGWKIKQLVHHVADSHMNAYMRFKLGLTEHSPTIKTYEEKAWANLKDSERLPANISITLLHALHARWYETLKTMTREDWDKIIIHPEHNREITLWHLLGMYSWHGRHHTAHINSARENHGWN
jgi:hypothetical protein